MKRTKLEIFVCFVILVVIALWLGTGYIAWQFISKGW